MMQAYLPSKQIVMAVGRTLLTGQSRWAYVAMAFVNVMIIGGGGLARGGSLQEFSEAATALLIVDLHILWIWFALRLLTVNAQAVARLVPHYVMRLRVTTLWIWLAIVLATSLLSGAQWGGLLWAALSSASTMLFLIAPFRWPVRWGLFTFVLVPFLARHTEFILKDVLPPLEPWTGLISVMCLGLIGNMVISLIHPRGSKYAEIFSRSSQALQKGASLVEPRLADLGIWGHYFASISQWVRLPFNRYASRLLLHPQTSSRNVLARCELALGATTHWVGQLAMLLALGAGMALWITIKQGGFAPLSATALTPYTLLTAALLLFIAVLPIAAMSEHMRTTVVEQKLQLLLPGMPRGNALTRKLAKRHLIQAYLSWAVVAAVAICLPFARHDRPIAISGYLAILVLLPILPTTQWARLGRLSAVNGLLGLALLITLGGSIFAMQFYCNATLIPLLAAAVSASLALLNWRWQRVKRFAQAFPAGNLTAAD